MTLVLVLKVPEGLVLAAESRATIKTEDKFGGKYCGTYDTATKLLSFKNHEYVGALVYGSPLVGNKTVYQYLPELQLPFNRLPVEDFARCLLDFFAEVWESKAEAQQKEKDELNFLVAGFDEGKEYGQVYWIGILPNQGPSGPMELVVDGFSYFAEGQPEIVHRLLKGYDLKLLDVLASKFFLDKDDLQAELDILERPLMIPYKGLSLQDSVELAIFLIKTTINAQRFVVSPRGCGGAIDICTITRWEGLRYIQRKDTTFQMHLF